MSRKLTRSTFKPQLESLETRDLPSAAGIAVYMDLQTIQQGIQAMQTQANAASSNFKQLGTDVQNNNVTAIADLTKIGGEVQAVRQLDNQINAGIQALQQAIPALLGGDQVDQFVAFDAYSQLSGNNLLGGLLGGLFGGSNSGSLSSQAKSDLDQVNKIATTTDVALPSGLTIPVSTLLGASSIDAALS